MNVQLPLFENADARVLKLASRTQESPGEVFNVQKFVESFEVLATVEGGIKKLRELVLALAVRGCLVPQLVAEGTGDALVTELAARRSKLSSVARVRAELAGVAPDEQRFLVPPSWRWLRLGHFGGFLGGGTPSKSNTSFWKGPIPWVSPKDMKRPYIDDAEDHISEAAVEGSAVKLIPRRSILFVVRGMILAHSFPVGMTTKAVTINQDMKALVLAVPETGEYLLRACWAARSRVLQRVERSSHGTCRLESEAVEDLPIPIPPLAEQRRIVAKVDELMRMLDDLEAKQTKKREIQGRLRSAALGALTSAQGHEEFDVAWKRLAENFEVLFERSDSVEELRLSVMDVASKGRLVPQAKQDQPASAVVAQKRQEIERCVGVDNLVLPSAEGDTLPPGWTWELLGNLGADPENPIQTGPFGAQLHRSEFVRDGVPVIAVGNLTGTGFTTDGLYFVTPAKAKMLSRYDVQAGDLLFARSGATTGKVCVAPTFINDWRMTGHILRVRLDPRLILPELLVLWLWGSTTVRAQVMGNIRGGTRPGYNTGLLKSIVVPVPPLAEQKRIVAKVEQLMKLCDDLEAVLQRSETTASKLVEAVVAEMVA